MMFWHRLYMARSKVTVFFNTLPNQGGGRSKPSVCLSRPYFNGDS